MGGKVLAKRTDYVVRLRCDHLTQFPSHAPRVGKTAWCSKCADFRVVVAQYYHGHKVQCGAQSRRVVENRVVTLRCTLQPHKEGPHYDEPFGIEFEDAEVTSKLRSGSYGAANIRA